MKMHLVRSVAMHFLCHGYFFISSFLMLTYRKHQLLLLGLYTLLALFAFVVVNQWLYKYILAWHNMMWCFLLEATIR